MGTLCGIKGVTAFGMFLEGSLEVAHGGLPDNLRYVSLRHVTKVTHIARFMCARLHRSW